MHFAERSFTSWLNAAYTYGGNDVIFARDRNQQWLLAAIENEFHQRHVLIRSLVGMCKGRPQLTSLTTAALKFAANAANMMRSEKLEEIVYSGLFNLQYYRGLRDEMAKTRSLSFLG